MKKLAIIGGSNALKNGGYGECVKSILGDDVDIYACGSSSSLWGIFTILHNDIIDNYETVLFDFNVNETGFLYHSAINKYVLVAYWIFIIKQFAQSKSKLKLMILPCGAIPYYESAKYIYYALNKIYGISLLDFDKIFEFMQVKSYAHDGNHPRIEWSKYISSCIIESLATTQAHIPNAISKETINFDCLFPHDLNNSSSNIITKGTSRIKLDCIKLSDDTTIDMPDDKYICGLVYWIEEAMPFLEIKGKSIILTKCLNVWDHKRLFSCRDCAYSLPGGLRAIQLSLTDDIQNKIYEITANEDKRSISCRSMAIAGILCSNVPPFAYGRDFMERHFVVFKEERAKLMLQYYLRKEALSRNFLAPVTPFFPEAKTILGNILNQRPDLSRYLHDENESLDINNLKLKSWWLLLWAWAKGRKEDRNIAANSDKIENAILSLIETPAQGALFDGFSYLHKIIGEIRSDLRDFDVNTIKGQKQFLLWFFKYGIYEYDLTRFYHQ